METNYKINKNALIISLELLYNVNDYNDTISDIRKIINKFLMHNNIKFTGNKIIVYKNGILIGTFYLTNFYLKKLKYISKDRYLTKYNSYFYPNNYLELNFKKN